MLNKNKHIFPITKFKYDENDSFKYFRSFITFYNWVTLQQINESQIKKEFQKYYGSYKYFKVYYNLFHQKKDMVIFTYYNQIPAIFIGFPDEYNYYYPIITFYNNNMKQYYQNSALNIVSTNDKRLINNDMIKFARNEVRVSIPIHMISQYQLPKKYVCFILHDGNCYITKEIEKDNYYISIKKYDIKKKYSYNYKSNNYKVKLKISEIKFISILLEITYQHLIDSFEVDIMKKESILYHNTIKEITFIPNFYSIYPKLNLKKFLFQTYENDKNWICHTFQLTKDIEVLNLTIDTFYNNQIVLKKKREYEYYDPTDIKYKNIIKDKLFRCINTAKTLSQHRDICNLNLSMINDGIYNKYNSGKRILYMIINKNMSYINKSGLYYFDFLSKLGIKSFVYNMGYVLKDGEQYHYDNEFAVIDLDQLGKYIKNISIEKGECNKIKYFPDKEIRVQIGSTKSNKK